VCNCRGYRCRGQTCPDQIIFASLNRDVANLNRRRRATESTLPPIYREEQTEFSLATANSVHMSRRCPKQTSSREVTFDRNPGAACQCSLKR
jgi:hypothetical protein